MLLQGLLSGFAYQQAGANPVLCCLRQSQVHAGASHPWHLLHSHGQHCLLHLCGQDAGWQGA